MRRDAPDFVRSAAFAAIVLAASLFLAVIGPFNTYGMGTFADRLFYWSGLVIVSSFLVLGLKKLLLRYDAPSWFAREVITILGFSAIFAPFVIFWSDVAFPSNSPTQLGYTRIFLYLCGICFAMSITWQGIKLGARSMPPTPATTQMENEPKQPRFARRLPQGFDGKILRVSGDGHYVNVSTTQGQFDVRIRLSDAIAEMDEMDGYWVHRSHWVSREAVTNKSEEKGRPILVLSNGDAVPVGPKYKSLLEQEGVL